MPHDLEISVYTLRHQLSALKQEALRIEERVEATNIALTAAIDAEKLAKQCYHITKVNSKYQSDACYDRLALASGKASEAISKSIMVMAERANNLKAQNALSTEIEELEQRQHA